MKTPFSFPACGHYRCDLEFCFKSATPEQLKEYYQNLANSESQVIEKYLKKQQTMKDKILFYCSCCNSVCEPILKKPIIENKLMDKIEVKFD